MNPARRLPLAPPAATWLELALDYRCNLRCLGCHACHDTGETMATSDAVLALRAGRRSGATRLWLGGGEPTLREDLLGLVRAARTLGFEEVLLQTNGARLSYPAYRDAIVAAGVTEVRFNVKSHREAVHDRASGAPSHALLLAALAGLTARPTRDVALSADLLLARSLLADLPETVTSFAERGISRFFLWLLSAADSVDPEVAAEVPTFAEVVPVLVEVARRAELAGAQVASFHTPPCTLPEALRPLFVPASSLGLTVVGPDGRSFPLEGSSFEGGAFLPGCAGCGERARCGGPRADYLRLHGGEAFMPLPSRLESMP